VAIVWGPIAGYFATRSTVPLVVVPLAERDSLSDFPFRFSIGMGVRRRDWVLRDSLQTVLDRKAPEIQAILKEYGVPMFPIPTEPKPQAKAPGGAPPALPDSGRAANR